MTTTVVIVSEEDGLFLVETPHRSDPLRQWDVAHCHGHEVAIRRAKDGRGYVISQGPGTIRLRYEWDGAAVGPRTDYLLPGQCKELGIGKGVAWRLIETG